MLLTFKDRDIKISEINKMVYGMGRKALRK